MSSRVSRDSRPGKKNPSAFALGSSRRRNKPDGTAKRCQAATSAVFQKTGLAFRQIRPDRRAGPLLPDTELAPAGSVAPTAPNRPRGAHDPGRTLRAPRPRRARGHGRTGHAGCVRETYGSGCTISAVEGVLMTRGCGLSQFETETEFVGAGEPHFSHSNWLAASPMACRIAGQIRQTLRVCVSAYVETCALISRRKCRQDDTAHRVSRLVCRASSEV